MSRLMAAPCTCASARPFCSTILPTRPHNCRPLQREALCSELGQELEGTQAALAKEQAVTAELRRILDAVRPKAGLLAEERDALKQQLELERTAAAEAQVGKAVRCCAHVGMCLNKMS